jgi:hypothetical protein
MTAGKKRRRRWENNAARRPIAGRAVAESGARAGQRRFYRTQRMSPRPPALPIWNFRLVDHAGVAHELFELGEDLLDGVEIG